VDVIIITSATCGDKAEICRKKIVLCDRINNVLVRFWGKLDPLTVIFEVLLYKVLWDISMSHAYVDGCVCLCGVG
jgi:hypothetical protein